MYEDFYHLYPRPFSLEPNPEFFFSGKEHKQALSYLRFAADKGEGNVVITGDKGTGKTILSKVLLSGLSSTEKVTGRLVASQSTDQDITVQICHEFGLPIRERTSTYNLIKVIQQFLQICHDLNRSVLLLVDDVQEISTDALEKLSILSDFKSDGSPTMQVFFIGRTEFRRTIMCPSMSDLKDLVIASSHLDPLSEKEVSAYINHRLRQAGWPKDELFTEDACHEIFHETGGVPGEINRLCCKLLSYGSHHEISYYNAAAVHLALSESAFEDTAV